MLGIRLELDPRFNMVLIRITDPQWKIVLGSDLQSEGDPSEPECAAGWLACSMANGLVGAGFYDTSCSISRHAGS